MHAAPSNFDNFLLHNIKTNLGAAAHADPNVMEKRMEIPAAVGMVPGLCRGPAGADWLCGTGLPLAIFYKRYKKNKQLRGMLLISNCAYIVAVGVKL